MFGYGSKFWMVSKCRPTSIKWNYQMKLFYNQFNDILRLFDVLPNFPFTTSETMYDYYLQTWHIRVASRVAERLKTYNLRKSGNIRTV